MKKGLWIFIGVGIFAVLLSVVVYWFYFSEPAPFPANEQLVAEMNHVFPEAFASKIQDTIVIDERHVVVPFIADNNDYGLSYWVWKKHQWIVGAINTNGNPMVWEIEKNDPSSYQFVWNIHPDDQLNSIRFYLIRDRGYQIVEKIERYYPKVQMEKKVSLKEKPYGVMPLPKEWAIAMNSFIKVESAKQPSVFFGNVFPAQYTFFGRLPYNQANQITFPKRAVNGNVYTNGDVELEYVRILDKEEIEISK